MRNVIAAIFIGVILFISIIELTSITIQSIFSPSNHSYLVLSDLFAGKKHTTPILQDSTGYVSIEKLDASKGDNHCRVLTSGTLRVNKDLTGKVIDIDVLNKTGELIATSAFLHLDNEVMNPPKVSDIRTFQTQVIYRGTDVTYRVRVHDENVYEKTFRFIPSSGREIR